MAIDVALKFLVLAGSTAAQALARMRRHVRSAPER
jgi:hypothetical protein